MGARMQREIELDQKTERRIAEAPEYVKAFFYWMNGKSPTTKEKYIVYTLQFVEFCKKKLNNDMLQDDDLKKISLGILNNYVHSISTREQKGVMVRNEPASINQKICAISTFFGFLKKQGIVEQNLCEMLDRPTIPEKDEIIYLTKEEVSAVLKNIEENGTDPWKVRDRLIFSFLVVTGIRVSALLDMDLEDIDFVERSFKVIEKENKHRKFIFPDELFDIFITWMAEREKIVSKYENRTNAIFIGEHHGNCKRLSVNGINYIIKSYTSFLNKKISAHKLRATMATNLLEEVNDVGLVADILGHKSPETTKRYARSSEKKKNEALKRMSIYMGV